MKLSRYHLLLSLLPFAKSFLIDASCDPVRANLESAIVEMQNIAGEAVKHIDNWDTKFGAYYKDKTKLRHMPKELKNYFSALFGDIADEKNRNDVKSAFSEIQGRVARDQSTVIYCGGGHLSQLRYVVGDGGQLTLDGNSNDPDSGVPGKKQYMWVDRNLGFNVETSYHDEISPNPCDLSGIKAVTYNINEEDADAPGSPEPGTAPVPVENAIMLCKELYENVPWKYTEFIASFGDKDVIGESLETRNSIATTLLHEAMHTYVMGTLRCPGGEGNEFYGLEAINRGDVDANTKKKNADSYPLFAMMCFHWIQQPAWTTSDKGIVRRISS